MATETIREKLSRITSNEPSKWVEDAKWRKENKGWLKKSQAIALKVLRTLREKKMQQKDLAKALGVSDQQISKIVKGKENLTLDTITKLEDALGVRLMEVSGESRSSDLPSSKHSYDFEFKTNKVQYYFELKQPDYHLDVKNLTKFLASQVQVAKVAPVLKATDPLASQNTTVYKPNENLYYKEAA